MDPVTAISLVGSLASLIQASHSLLRVIKDFRDGDKELGELGSDVAMFAEALKGFDRVLRSRRAKHEISPSVIGAALDDALATINELKNRCDKIAESDISAVRRAKWLQHRSTLKRLHERLRFRNAMLQEFLTMAHMFVNILIGA